MENVTAYIHQRTLELQGNPFIEWLSDTTVPARERLSAWFPGAAFFVMGFRDLNAEIFKYPEHEAAQDPLKQAVNDHVAEDSNHWQWYLSDLRKLDLDKTMKFSDAMRLLWSPETRCQRLAAYEFCVLASRATDPMIRYSLLSALEAFAHVLFGTLLPISKEFEAETGIRLSYLGQIHFEREPGHLLNQGDETEDLFNNCRLDDESRTLAIEIAGAVWTLIDSRWREFYNNASARVEVEVGAN